MQRRKRRESVPRLQNLLEGPIRFPVPDIRPTDSPASLPRGATRSPLNDPAPRRYRQRPRKLTPDQEAAIRALAATRSLRSLAADFGVSHETIRVICCRTG